MTLKMLTNRYVIFFQKFSEYFQVFLLFFLIYLIENSKMSQKKIFFFQFLSQFSTPNLPRKPHPILFLLLKSSTIAENVYLIWEIFFFMTMPWKNLLEPSEIVVFGFKMSYIRHKNGSLRTAPISKLEFFFQDIVRQFNKLPGTSHFLKKNH